MQVAALSSPTVISISTPKHSNVAFNATTSNAVFSSGYPTISSQMLHSIAVSTIGISKFEFASTNSNSVSTHCTVYSLKFLLLFQIGLNNLPTSPVWGVYINRHYHNQGHGCNLFHLQVRCKISQLRIWGSNHLVCHTNCHPRHLFRYAS